MNEFCLGYVIEKCPEGSDRWEKVPGVFNQPKGTVKDLETNKKYKFRVKAENIYGVSEPLETNAGIVVKPPYGTRNYIDSFHALIDEYFLQTHRMHPIHQKLPNTIPPISN